MIVPNFIGGRTELEAADRIPGEPAGVCNGTGRHSNGEAADPARPRTTPRRSERWAARRHNALASPPRETTPRAFGLGVKTLSLQGANCPKSADSPVMSHGAHTATTLSGLAL